MPDFNRDKFTNNLDEYKDLLDKREVENIEHYLTFTINTDSYKDSYTTYEHVWKKGDKLYKLSQRYYGNIDNWWVIALYNNKPTDAHFSVGDVIQIPYSAAEIRSDVVR